jgi:hypothetical protein
VVAGYMGAIPPPSRGDKDAQRRSRRVMLKVSVVVFAHRADNKRVSEETRTVTVNAHGLWFSWLWTYPLDKYLCFGIPEPGRKCHVESYI